MVQLVFPLEPSRVDHPDRDEDDLLELIREDPEEVQERMDAEATERGDREHGGLRALLQRLRVRLVARERDARQALVQTAEARGRVAIVAPNQNAHDAEKARREKRRPAALHELERDRPHEERTGYDEAEAADRQRALPALSLPTKDQRVAAHGELREGERQEDVDRV